MISSFSQLTGEVQQWWWTAVTTIPRCWRCYRRSRHLSAKDPTTFLENRMNSVLLRLRREGRLSGKTTTTFVAQQLVSHVSMDCSSSTSLMPLFAQLYPLCPHPCMHCPSSLPPCWYPLSAFLTPTWVTHSSLVSSLSLRMCLTQKCQCLSM